MPPARGITARTAGRGTESAQRPGRHRWVVERTPAWFTGHRRPAIRHERSASLYRALPALAAALTRHERHLKLTT
jgi:transposase